MRCTNCYLFLLVFLAARAFPAHAGVTAISGQWQFNYDGQWVATEAPFSIHTDLLNNKLIEDPFYADNESRLQWIGQRDW